MSFGDITNVTTGEARLSYVHLFKPHAQQPGAEEKFSCTVLVPKSDTATKARIDAAIEAAKQKGINGKWNGVCPPIVPHPVYDGDGVRPSDGMPFGPECKGHWVFTASAKADYPPEVVDQNGNPMINQSEMYSGAYALVNVEFYPYMFGGKKRDRLRPWTGKESPGRGGPGWERTNGSTGLWSSAGCSTAGTCDQSDHRAANVAWEGAVSPFFKQEVVL